MGVLQDFERRLEGAVEGFFARAFRSGLQPVELAKAIQRYAEDNRHVTADGIVVPNEYQFRISVKDDERLAQYGTQLTDELAEVVERTATEEDWRLKGPARVTVERDEQVSVGRYELTGRVHAAPRPAVHAAAAPPPAARDASSPKGETPPPPPPEDAPPPRRQAALALVADDGTTRLPLDRPRLTIGRLDICDFVLDDPTVSREHAAVVRRGDTWWVLDLGSTNGTRVNGIQAAEQVIQAGDELELGDATLSLRQEG